MTATRSKKLLFLMADDRFFCSHFIERAVAAKRDGYDVAIITPVSDKQQTIQDRGLRVIPLTMDRGGINPFHEARVVRDLIRTYWREKPDIVHQVALKPVLYGSLAAFLSPVRAVVNAPVGMGYIFISASMAARVLRFAVRLWLRFFLCARHGRVIFENNDDLRTMVRDGYVPANRAALIRGAGIDLQTFAVKPEPPGPPVIILTARMLWDKGVGEFVEAARLVKKAGLDARFLLVGAPDPRNRACIEESVLHDWQREGIVQWLGFRADIPDLLCQSHIVCLPSYREGLPKSLLEALACARAVVTTDVEGCREAVEHNVNGLLVPARDARALAQALITLIQDPALRQRMGQAGRHRAETEFSQERVIAETLAVYASLSPRD